MGLITVQELEAFMGKEFTPAETIQAEVMIDSISAIIESITGITFAPVTDEQILIQADGHGIIEFATKPVTNVSSVKDINGEEVDDWEFDGLSAIYNLFPAQVVSVTHSYGYSTVPNDIKAVVYGAASRVMYNPSGLRQETVGAISVTYPGIGGEAGTINFSALEKKILENYAKTEASFRLLVTQRRTSCLPILTLNNNIQ